MKDKDFLHFYKFSYSKLPHKKTFIIGLGSIIPSRLWNSYNRKYTSSGDLTRWLFANQTSLNYSDDPTAVSDLFERLSRALESAPNHNLDLDLDQLLSNLKLFFLKGGLLERRLVFKILALVEDLYRVTPPLVDIQANAI